MTIYFDENLNAYNTKPISCVGETEDYKWAFYSQLPKNIAWTVRDYQLVDLRDTEEYKEYQKQKEQERIGNLSMTRGDVFEALILARGLTKPQIRAMIEQAELDTMTKALYLNRFDEALDFYRGFPVFDMLGQALGVTPKQLDDFFETKDYHYLTDITLKINATPSEAVVTINGKTTKEFSTPWQPNLQLPITYSVACEGYTTKEDEIVLTENTVLEVVLEEEIIK